MKTPQTSIFSSGSRFWPILLVVIATGYLLYQIKSAPVTHFDDAFMYIRYADNILAGKGYSWNGEGNTFGCTSITYTLFVTGVKAVFSELPHHRLLVFCAGFWALASIGLMAFTAFRLLSIEKWKQPLWILAGFLLFFGFNLGFRMNLLTGMDTMMSLFANTLIVLLAFEAGKKPKIQWFLLLALAGWFAILTRPDNGIYVLLMPGLVFLWIYQLNWKQVSHAYIWIGAVLIADLGLKVLLFGDPLPLPAYVKQGGFYAGYIGGVFWNPIEYLMDFFAYAFPFTLGLIICFTSKNWKSLAALLLPLFITFLYYFSVVQIMGTHHRFYFPGLPFLIFGAILALEHWWKQHQDQPWAAFRSRIPALIVAVGIWLGLWGIGRPLYAKLFLTNRNVPEEQLTEIQANQLYHHIPNWSPFDNLSRIAGNMRPGLTLAASEHGVIAAENPGRPILDLVGLHDPEIAHNGFSMEYLRTQDPELIWMPHHHYVTLNHTLINDPWFQERYYFIPGVFKFGIAIRKDREDVFDVVLKELMLVYPKECYETYLPDFMLPKLAKGVILPAEKHDGVMKMEGLE